MPLVCDKLSIRLKEQGLRKYDLRKDKIIGMSALGKLRKNEGHIDTRTIEALCEYLHCQPGDIIEYFPEGETDKGEYGKMGLPRPDLVLYLDVPGASYWALAIFVAASLTDTLDGYIARHYNQVTDFGKFMDPLADKCLVVAAMLWFVEIGQMPAWAVLIVVIREFAVSGLRMVAADKGRVIAAGWSGKVKTASTMVCIVLMLIPPVAREISSLCVAVIVLTTIYSGVEYFIKNLDVLSGTK